MHPLSGNLSEIKDGDLETKIFDLTKKYFMTSNPGVKQQISLMLDTYNEELGKRRQATLEKMMENRDKKLDSLIKVS
jgi:hypothetical protein